jgi:predicted 2-oxoglutarate/Fe(II)-dependent dioxygenase YbiX
MLLHIVDLIDKATVRRLQDWLAQAKFADGRSTAGSEARKVKQNEQVDHADPSLADMQKLVTGRLWDHSLFTLAAQPHTILPGGRAGHRDGGRRAGCQAYRRQRRRVLDHRAASRGPGSAGAALGGSDLGAQSDP